jgi:competence protein ComEC
VSGANLAIMLAFMLVLARWIGVRGWWLRFVGLVGVIIFVALCRTEPSVLRAAAMGLVALAALGMSGRAKGLRSLFVAMILLLIVDPWLGRSVGFALSVLASGGIVWLARTWAMALRRWLPMIMAESIAVPLAAHLITLPVSAAISGQVSMIGVLTNAVAGPFVGPATVLGFAAAGVSLISGTAAGLLGWAACWAAQPILWAGHYGSALPGSSWIWPTSPPALAVLAIGCLLLCVAMPWALRRAWLAAVLALVLIIAVIRAPSQPGWPPRDWLLVACDVGQGDGLVVRTGDRQGIVIDAGPEPGSIGRCLDQLRIRVVPLVILTHFHADHVAGLPGVLAGRTVQEIWISPFPSPLNAATGISRLAATRSIEVRVPATGTEAPVGPARVAVLGPVDREPDPVLGDGEESSAENDLSLTTMITIEDVRILMTGDIEPGQQQKILDSGADLAADVLKVPHHGSARQDPAFIAATDARLAIASAGQDNGYGHPAPRTVGLLRSEAMTVLCTCRRGSIAVTADERRLGVVTQRGGN